MDIYRMGWDEVMRMVKILAKQIQGKHIWGVPRGGAIVTALMSYHGCELADNYNSCEVLVDDITCTGRTLSAYERPSAVLVIRRGCVNIPTWYVTILQTKEYVLFPWENEEDVKLQSNFRSGDS